MKNDVLEDRTHPRESLRPSGTHLGPKRHPKRHPKRAQNATKKRTQKKNPKKSEKTCLGCERKAAQSLGSSRFALVLSFRSSSLVPLSFSRFASCFALVLSFRSRSLVSYSFSPCALVLSSRRRSLVSLLFSLSALVLILFVFSRFALVLLFRSCFSFRSRSLVPLSPLGVNLGSLGSLLEPLGSLLGAKMANFSTQNGSRGAFWSLLASLGALLGASWSVLGRSWGDLFWR